MLSEAGMSQSV